MDGDRDRVLSSGFDGYMEKPISVRDFPTEVRRHLTDREVELAVLQLQSDFAAGDFVGGLTRGIAMLAEHARPQQTLHAGG